MSKLKERILFMVFGAILMVALLLILAWYQVRTPTAIAKTTAQLFTCRVASTNFLSMAGRWPTSVTELVTNSMGIVFIYPSPPIPDGWGRQIMYEPYTTNSGYGRFVSYGRDGKPGGVGADADIEQRFP